MDGSPTPPSATAVDRPVAGTRQAFLPSEVDPTVFDEAFLRQLERLLLLMRSPVRGGLKGGRRSVKRGQSVEFADYRDYSLGDDLRQLDWNVYARLERLFVKLFVEEEDVTITLLIDASASMATGTPAKLLFAKRAAAALGYIGLASEDRVAVSALTGRIARRRAAMRGSGRVFRLLADLSSIESADGPTDIVAAARHAGAQLHGRGVVVLISDLLDPGGRQGHPRARRDGLGAGHPPRPVARRARSRSSRATCGWSTSRPATASTSPSTSPRSTPTRSASRPGRRASPTSPPSAGRATSTCRRTRTSPT